MRCSFAVIVSLAKGAVSLKSCSHLLGMKV